MADINTQSISLFLKSHALLVATKYPASFFARVIVKYNTCGIRKSPTRAKDERASLTTKLQRWRVPNVPQLMPGTPNKEGLFVSFARPFYIPLSVSPSPRTQRGSYCRWKVKKKPEAFSLPVASWNLRADRGPTTAERLTYPFCWHPVSFCKFWAGLEEALISPALSSSFHHKTKLVCAGNTIYALPYKVYVGIAHALCRANLKVSSASRKMFALARN